MKRFAASRRLRPRAAASRPSQETLASQAEPLDAIELDLGAVWTGRIRGACITSRPRSCRELRPFGVLIPSVAALTDEMVMLQRRYDHLVLERGSRKSSALRGRR